MNRKMLAMLAHHIECIERCNIRSTHELNTLTYNYVRINVS